MRSLHSAPDRLWPPALVDAPHGPTCGTWQRSRRYHRL